MDLPDRTRRELDLAAALNAAYEPLRRDASAGQLVRHDWNATQRSVAAAIKTAIADTYATMALAVFLLVAQDEDAAPDFLGKADVWATARSERIAREMVDNIRPAPSDLVPDDIVPQNRIDNVAITETTGAYGEGVHDGRDEAEKYGQIKIPLVWVTALDDRVCTVCWPLHNQPDAVYTQTFPTGPPAHPRCRCTLMPVFRR